MPERIDRWAVDKVAAEREPGNGALGTAFVDVEGRMADGSRTRGRLVVLYDLGEGVVGTVSYAPERGR